MPGPGKKNLKKKSESVYPVVSGGPKKSGPSELIPRIDDLEGWNVIIAVLCKEFDLPDMNTRNGLKKIHTDFQDIYRKLNKAYTENSTNEKITGGIVGIWAKMSVDSLLRDKLLREGLISKILPLLDAPATRYVALQALSAITHHGGIEARQPIAKETTPTLIRLMQELPDDYEANDLIIGTLSHAVGAVLNEQYVDGKMLKLLNIPAILRLLLENMQKPEASMNLLNHAYDFITAAAFHCHQEVKTIPPLIPLIISTLRTTDIAVRCGALATLNRLHIPDAEPEIRGYNMENLVYARKSGYPEHLATLLEKYGPHKCEIFLMLQCIEQRQRAMKRVAQDHDLCSLGRTLGELITTTEFALSAGPYEMFTALTMDMSLPFRMWTDALPFCAKALRENGSRSDLDVADILDIKFDLIRSCNSDAVERANKAIERNPNIAYFYYAIGMGADRQQALRAVKKGLKAKHSTSFVRLYLLWRAVENAGDMGMMTLTYARAGEPDYIGPLLS